jgi:ribonuclease E
MGLDVMRRLQIAIHDQRVNRVELAVCTEVAFYLQNRKRRQLSELEERYEKRILVRGEPNLGLDEMRVDLFDNREGLVFLEELGMIPQPPHTTQLGTRPQPVQQRGGRGGGRGDRGRRHDQHRQPPPSRRPAEDELGEDRFERVEEEMEGREQHTEPQPQQEREQREPAPAFAQQPGGLEGDRQGQEQEGGGRRRRRRRRGRRGRGRNRQFADAQNFNGQDRPQQAFDDREHYPERESQEIESDHAGPEGNRTAAADFLEVSERVVEELPPEPVRENRRAEDAAIESPAMEPPPEAPPAKEPKPKRSRRRAAATTAKPKTTRGRKRKASTDNGQTEEAEKPAPQQAQVVRTGSTDRHLIEDEPVLPQPVRRPRNAVDLDHIPDDFD